jgi:iron complex transport system ATP-binding protein
MTRRKKPPIIEVEQLVIERGSTRILDGVAWRVDRGQHWVIVGANGSGKTSLLSALNGFLMPTSGEIWVLGKRYGASDWRSLRCHIGLVSSSVRQMMADSETALESIVSGRYAMIDFWGKMSARDRRAGLRILEQVECAHLRDRPWIHLSQGERQRVLIGRAMMAQPKLLILDEPCAGLDPAAREHFLQFLERLGRQRSGPALVLVTHHVEEIMPVFTHALVLARGRVIASGEKAKVLTSRNLSRAFGARIRLAKRDGRCSLQVSPARGRMV